MNFKLGKSDFLGILFFDKHGNKKLVKPHPDIKKYIDKYLDERNGIK